MAQLPAVNKVSKKERAGGTQVLTILPYIVSDEAAFYPATPLPYRVCSAEVPTNHNHGIKSEKRENLLIGMYRLLKA